MPACQSKRTKLVSLISFIAFTLAISVFSGCGGNKNDNSGKSTPYSVSFDSNGGSSVTARSVQPGGAVSEPSPAPTRAGYVFGGWYTDNNTFVYEVSFPFTPTGNITLYAKWTKIDDGDPGGPDDLGGTKSGGMFSITGIAIDRGTNTVKVEISTESSASLNIDILEDVTGVTHDWESGKKLDGGVLNVKVPVDNEFVAVKVPSALPKYFVVVASLTDDDGENLCDPFTFIEYTKAHEQFMATTIHDFPAEKVLNLDASEDNNFMVVAAGVAIIKAGENGRNNLDPELSEGNTYVFHNAGEEISSLYAGNRIVVTANDGKDMFLVKVAKITVSGSDVTIVASEDNELSDFFDFIKIDKSEYVDTVTLDMSEADEGVKFYADPKDLPDVFAGDDQTMKSKAVGISSESSKINFSGANSLGLNFTLELNSGVLMLKGSLSGKLKGTTVLRYDSNRFGEKYYYIKLFIGLEATFNVNAGLKVGTGDGKTDKSSWGKLIISFPQLIFPLGIPGLTANTKPEFVVDLELSAGVKFTAMVAAEGGFISQSGNSLQPKFDKMASVELVDVSGKFTMAVGPQIVPAISFWMGMIKGEFEIFAGAELEVEGDVKFSDTIDATTEDEKHACESWVDGSVDLLGKITFKFKLLWGVVKAEYTGVEYRLPLYNFHVSLENHPSSVFGGKKGYVFGLIGSLGELDCPNKSYRTILSPRDEQDRVLKDAAVNIRNTTTNYMNRTRVGEFSEFLYPGPHVASASLDGYTFTDENFTVAKPTEVFKETRTVVIKGKEDPEEKYKITFSPRDEKGNVLTDAIVTVENMIGTPMYWRVGKGQFEDNLPPGNYVASAQLGGYTFTDEPFTADKDIIARTIIIKGKEAPAFQFNYEMVRVGNGTFTMGCTPEKRSGIDYCDDDPYGMGFIPGSRIPYHSICYYHNEDYDYVSESICFGINGGVECSGGGYYTIYDEVCRDEELPAHEVTLTTDSFEIGKYEVTQAQWKAVMGADNNPSYFKGDNLPVENVSWDDVKEFISKLNQMTGWRYGYRLPTEAEWEYAARGGGSRKYRYSGSNDIEEVAWYVDNSEGKTHPVGKKQANELGIYDMSGNVSEWVSGWLGEYSESPQTDPQNESYQPPEGIRGGHWDDSGWRPNDVSAKNWYVLGARVWGRGDHPGLSEKVCKWRKRNSIFQHRRHT